MSDRGVSAADGGFNPLFVASLALVSWLPVVAAGFLLF